MTDGPNAGDGVSVRAFAQQIGISHVAVLKRLKSGSLPRNEDGTIPLAAGLAAYAESTKGKPARKTAAAKKPATKKAPAKPKAAPKKQAAPVAAIDDEPGDNLAPAIGEASAVATAYNKAKLAEKTYQAKLKELDFKLRKRELIPRSEVEEQVEALAVKVRGKLLAVPVRVAVMCEGRPAREIEDIFATALDEALADMQRGLKGL